VVAVKVGELVVRRFVTTSPCAGNDVVDGGTHLVGKDGEQVDVTSTELAVGTITTG
jgi:hypothetical protein